MGNLKRDIEMVVVESLREFEDKKHRAFELLDQGKIPRPAEAVEAEHARLTTTQIINLIESVVDEDKLWAVKAWFVDSCKHKARTLKDVKLVEYIDYLESKLIGGSNG